MEFVAIDFETANEQSSSACQLGAVVVRGGVVVDSHCWWIRPRPLRFSSQNIAIHGITPRQVAEEGEFCDLWEEIWQVLRGSVLVAHNAGFDIGVLRACLQMHQLSIPDLQFTCTRAVARQAWPNHSGFGLRAIADRLGIQFQHHDALEDSMACAHILLAAAEKVGEESLEGLEQRLRLCRGRAGEWGCGVPRTTDQRRTGGRARSGWSRSANGSHLAGDTKVYQRRLNLRGVAGGSSVSTPCAAETFHAWADAASEAKSFSGCNIVFTGILAKMEREQAEQLVVMSGGRCTTSVSKRTDVVVVGAIDARTRQAGRSISTKEERAKQLQSEGQAIRIVTEEEWLALLMDTGQTMKVAASMQQPT